jgi:hypothetical protein
VGFSPLYDLVVDDAEAWGAKDEFQIVDGVPIASFEILPSYGHWGEGEGMIPSLLFFAFDVECSNVKFPQSIVFLTVVFSL